MSHTGFMYDTRISEKNPIKPFCGICCSEILCICHTGLCDCLGYMSYRGLCMMIHIQFSE
jgi:hypothetical protein